MFFHFQPKSTNLPMKQNWKERRWRKYSNESISWIFTKAFDISSHANHFPCSTGHRFLGNPEKEATHLGRRTLIKPPKSLKLWLWSRTGRQAFFSFCVRLVVASLSLPGRPLFRRLPPPALKLSILQTYSRTVIAKIPLELSFLRTASKSSGFFALATSDQEKMEERQRPSRPISMGCCAPGQRL